MQSLGRALTVALLFFAWPISAAEIDVPPVVAPHHLVEYKIKADGKAYAHWVIKAGSEVYVRVDSGDESSACFTGEPGVYLILATVVLEDGTIEKARANVTIGDTPIPPGPFPPGPTPTPVVPEGAFGLTKFAYDETRKLPPASRANALGVATNLEAVAAAAAAGAIPDVAAMHKQAKEKNQVTLANDLAAWKPWSVAFQGKMQSLFDAGTVTTVSQTAEAMRAAAEGLKLASKEASR